MRDWEAIIPDAERLIYDATMYGGLEVMGRRPALLVVDCNVGFTGTQPRSLSEAIREYSGACGPAAWEALPRISALLDTFRRRRLPVVYTVPDPVAHAMTKLATKADRHRPPDPASCEFVPSIAPRAGEWVLHKARASAFFATPLTGYLVEQDVDSVVVCGVSTSGCVRATVVDAFSSGYTVFVVDECCFDRARTPHLVNLFDMNAKYASVISLAELDRLLAEIPEQA